MKNKSYLLLIPFPFILGLFINVIISMIMALVIGQYKLAKGEINADELVEYLTGIAVNQEFLSIAIFTIGIICIVVFGIWYYYLYGRKSKIFMYEAISINNFILLLLLGIVIQIMLSFSLTLILPFFKDAAMKYEETMGMLFSDSWLMIIYTAVLAPFGEEMIFRGLTFGYAKKVMPIMGANIVQAALFGIYHLNLIQGIYAFVMGLIFGYIMMKLKSIWAVVILHIVVNISGLIMNKILTNSTSIMTWESVVIDVIAITICILLVLGLPVIKEHEKVRDNQQDISPVPQQKTD